MSKTLVQTIIRTRTIIKEPLHAILKDKYSTGTVAVTNGSATVTGTSTVWLTSAKAGQTFHISGGKYYHILSIASDTSLTLSENYAGTTAGTASYVITPGNVTDAELVEVIAGAQRELVAQIETLDENYFATSGTISYVSGTETYALPTGLKKILLVYRIDLTQHKRLYPILLQERLKYLASSTTADADALKEYFYLAGTNIGIVPIPTTSATNNLTVHYVPEATDPTTDSSSIFVPDDCFEALCYLAASKVTDDSKVQQTSDRLYAHMLRTIGDRIKTESRYIIDKDEDNFN